VFHYCVHENLNAFGSTRIAPVRADKCQNASKGLRNLHPASVFAPAGEIIYVLRHNSTQKTDTSRRAHI